MHFLQGRLRLAPAWRTLWVSATALGAVYLVLLLFDLHYSRLLLIAGSVVVTAGLVGWGVLTRRGRAVGAAVAIVAGVSAVAFRAPGEVLKALLQNTYLVPTSHVTLVATEYRALVADGPASEFRGGAIAALPDGHGYILVRAQGDMYSFDWDGKGEIQFRQIPGRVPINSEEFLSDLPEDVDGRGFRVADLLVHGQGQDAQLLATHHYWKGEDQCFVVRLSSLPLADVLEGSPDQAGAWETVFESRPCLPFKTARGAPFAGVQIGGNLETLTDDEILLTVGDHQFDGWYGSPNYVEDMSSDYGKTIVIDLADGDMTRIFTSGHRNAQGLVIDGVGRSGQLSTGPRAEMN